MRSNSCFAARMRKAERLNPRLLAQASICLRMFLGKFTETLRSCIGAAVVVVPSRLGVT